MSRDLTSEPYASEEEITLPVSSDLAAKLAAEIYLLPKQRSVSLLRLGTVDLGYWRIVSITTMTTPGGYKQIVGTYQRILK